MIQYSQHPKSELVQLSDRSLSSHSQTRPKSRKCRNRESAEIEKVQKSRKCRNRSVQNQSLSLVCSDFGRKNLRFPHFGRPDFRCLLYILGFSIQDFKHTYIQGCPHCRVVVLARVLHGCIICENLIFYLNLRQQTSQDLNLDLRVQKGLCLPLSYIPFTARASI